PTAADVPGYGRRVRARQTLYKDAAAGSGPAYPIAGDEAVAARERNPNALAHVFGDAPMAGPDPGTCGDKDPPSRWHCSGHRPPNIAPSHAPVVTAETADPPPSAFDDRTVCPSPVITLARNSR